MAEPLGAISEAIERDRPAMIGLLAGLVQIPTENPPGRSLVACADALDLALSRLGFHCERLALDADDGEPRPILVATDSARVRHQLNLSWGVVPFILPRCRTVEELVDRSVGHLKKEKMVQIGDKIIVIAGEPVGSSGGVNLVEIREIK